MTNAELVNRAVDIARNHKTLYVFGSFGAPLTDENKDALCNHTAYNKQADRTAMIRAASADTFGFDCSGLIKGILWGWDGDRSHDKGGAVYASNGVPDISANMMIQRCGDISTDFGYLVPGELVWTSGHVGLYIGGGLAVECTPKWANCVQITSCNCTKAGYNRRNWAKHGKLPWVEYPAAKSVEEIAREVIAGKWGVGIARKDKLAEAGYSYTEVQTAVNEILKSR